MNIHQFLSATRDSKEVHLRESAGENVAFLWDVYDEIASLILEDSEKPELVVSVSNAQSSQTQLVSLDRQYIVIELNQLHILAREITALHGSSEPQDTVPIFFSMLARANRGTATPREKRIIQSSEALQRLSELNGFALLFKPIVAYIIAHELFHGLVKKPAWSKNYEKFKISLSLHHREKVEFDYVDDRIQRAYSHSTHSHQIEELFCDEMALMISWRVCVNKSSFHPTILCFSIALLHNILLIIACENSSAGIESIPGIFSRKIYALRLCTVLYDKYVATLVKYIPELYQHLGIIFGSNEVVIECVNHLGLKSVLVRVGSNSNRAILDIEAPTFSMSDDEPKVSILEIPAEFFQMIIAHNLVPLRMIASSNNPMYNSAFKITASQVDSPKEMDEIMFKMKNGIEARTEFLEEFWKKVTR